MLAADHRLREGDAFRRTVRSGRRAGSTALVVHLATGDQGQTEHQAVSRPEPPRVGFVVSKAVGGAVVRNRVRRRLRHLVRTHLVSLPASSALVVRALPPAAGLDSAELDAELTRCLDRVLRARAQGGSRGATRTGAGA